MWVCVYVYGRDYTWSIYVEWQENMSIGEGVYDVDMELHACVLCG